jgi:hydrogenase maturation factor
MNRNIAIAIRKKAAEVPTAIPKVAPEDNLCTSEVGVGDKDLVGSGSNEKVGARVIVTTAAGVEGDGIFDNVDDCTKLEDETVGVTTEVGCTVTVTNLNVVCITAVLLENSVILEVSADVEDSAMSRFH